MECEVENYVEYKYKFLYNFEAIRSFKKFFRVEGTLLGFKFSLNQRLKSKCYYDFGLKFKLKGNLKNFLLWKQIFKTNLHLNSLYLKKEILNNNFCIIQKKSQNFLSLYFSNIFVNNYEKLKKFHFYKIYNRIFYMNYENHNLFPLQLIVSEDYWFINFMFKIKTTFFNKFYSLLKRLIFLNKWNLFLIKNKFHLFKKINLFLMKKRLIFFMKKINFFKRPFLKHVLRNLRKYKLKYKRKNEKFKMKKKFKYQFRFFKKFKWNKKRKFKFKFKQKENLKFKFKQKENLKRIAKNKLYGIFLQKRFNKVYLNNIIRIYLYNCKKKLKRYYDLITLNWNIKNIKKSNIKNVFLKKKTFFFSSIVVWFNKPYLKILNKFLIIILLLYKKNYLVNDIGYIIKLFIQFKYYLLKLINKNLL
jgi:hypothetical protein